MFHIYFLIFTHTLFDLRCFWVGALISGITSLISTGVSAGLQVEQMKKQQKNMDKQLELTQKQMQQTQNTLDKQNADKKALGESLNQSADSIKSASENSAGMSAVGENIGGIGGIDGNLNSLGGLNDSKTGVGISTKSAMDKE